MNPPQYPRVPPQPNHLPGHQQYHPGFPGQQFPPPPRKNVKKSNRTTFIILGSIVAFIVILFIAVMAFSNGLVSKEKKTIAKMESIVSRIVPGDDWVEKYSMDPKVDPACIPSNVACHRLQRSWDTNGGVEVSEVQKQLGIELKAGGWKGCLVGKEDNISVELCISNDDTPQVNLWLQD